VPIITAHQICTVWSDHEFGLRLFQSKANGVPKDGEVLGFCKPRGEVPCFIGPDCANVLDFFKTAKLVCFAY
ncbi:MAG: hypothetical protein EBT73_02250, partial [Actinobacteria bacterium]|nr:hypothetical protein [Actinomycetota bacterium]